MRVYVAGGWFSTEMEKALLDIDKALKESGMGDVFRPREDNLGGEGSDWNKIFQSNIKEINSADMIVVSTVGKDMGTLFEAGVAYNLGKEVIYYTPGVTVPNLMLGMSGSIANDLPTLIRVLKGGKGYETETFE